MQALLKVGQGRKVLCRFLHIAPPRSPSRHKLWSAASVLQTRNITSHKVVPVECLPITKFGRNALQSKNILCLAQQRFQSTVRGNESRDKVADGQEKSEYKPFYRLPYIVGLRILSRVKIAQTCFTLAILPPLYYYHEAGMVSTWQLQLSIGTATFALFMLYTMSFFLRRVVGAMYLHRDGDVLKVSHLTFWGSRRDTVLPVMDVIPLSEGSNKAEDVLMKLERYTTKDILYFTLRFGRVIDVEVFENVFGRPQ
eukprot:XP_796429.1 PREDICTED: transmembrane protein 186-like [Strongylocentrotus purpuratus]